MQKRYRETRVRVHLVEENVYDAGVTLNVIRFTEFLDEVSLSSKQEIAMPQSPQIGAKGKGEAGKILLRGLTDIF